MSTSRTVRSSATWRVAWMALAAAVAVLASGCASGIAGQPLALTPAASDWNPQHLQTVAADIHQSAVTIHVGERLQFTARDSDTVYFDVEPVDLRSLTFYGNALTFVGTTAGSAVLKIPNYDKHFDCPNGPCAHPNAPLSVTVTVLAAAPGAAAVPAIPAAILVSTATGDRTVHLKVGQALQIARDLQMSTYDSGVAGSALTGEFGDVAGTYGSPATLVGALPGTQMIGLTAQPVGPSVTETRVTIVIDA